MEDGLVLGDRNLASGAIEWLEVGVGSTAVVVAQLRARDRELGTDLDEREHPPPERRHTVAGRGSDRLDAAEVGRRVVPPVGPGELDQLARRQRGGEAFARLVVEQLPVAIANRRVWA